MEEHQNQADLKDMWALGEPYEHYVGRWSRLVAEKFLAWLSVPAGGSWLDVGCGTGALTETILNAALPREVKGIDAAGGFLAYARRRVSDPRLIFEQGNAQALPVESGRYEAVVSGFALNFFPDGATAIGEMARTARLDGVVAAYVWDYAGRMQFLRYFWNAATALHPETAPLDEGLRFPLCNPGPLAELFNAAGLREVEVMPIDIWTVFKDFEDYWQPFLGGQGPAPSLLMSLGEQERDTLRERLRLSLPFAVDGSIPLMARAWAVRGIR